MERVIFLIIAVSLTIFLLYLVQLYKNLLFVTLFILVSLILIAFYLFQFGNLSEFNLKAFNSEATFIKEKKQEVIKDIEEINDIKKQIKATKENIDKLEKQIVETAKKAEPPTLLFKGHETKQLKDRVEVVLQFYPDKNVPLGMIVFKVTIDKKSDANILDIWPDLKGGAYSTGDQSKQIAKDKKSATLSYSLIGTGSPTIKITLSSFDDIVIQGNYLKGPLIHKFANK